MITTDEIILELLDVWLETETAVDVVCDDRKLSILVQVLEAASPGVTVPERVREFYREVYLRDVWEGIAGS